MALPPWTVDLLRRSLADVAKRATEPETIQKLRDQATELFNELPVAAARGLDRVMRSAEAGKESIRRWSRKHTALSIPMLNATGVLVHPEGTGVPTSEEALGAAVDVLRGDAIGGDVFMEQIERRFAKLAPAGRAIALTKGVTPTLSWLAMLLPEHQIVVHRHHSVRLPNGKSLASSISMVTEVGASDSVEENDFLELDANDNQSLAIVQADTGSVAIAPVKFQSQSSRVTQIAVLPMATFSPCNVVGISSPIPSSLAMLESGFDLVIMSGSDLAGGPKCGLLVGTSELIKTITQSECWGMGDAMETMMLVTLEASAPAADATPMGALLATSEENLKGRAERMALRLSSAESIAASRVSDNPARVTLNGRWTMPSRQVRLRHQSMTADAWSTKLRDDFPSLWVNVDGDEIVVDLRWIAPAEDNKIASTLAGESAGASST
jgi:L-seryl-tRNA(Ser) seleniumtransferase